MGLGSMRAAMVLGEYFAVLASFVLLMLYAELRRLVASTLKVKRDVAVSLNSNPAFRIVQP